MAEFASESGIASSTFRRAAVWLLGLLPGLFLRRRPGPCCEEERGPQSTREAAVKKLTDFYAWLRTVCLDTKKNDCYGPEAKQRIAAVAQEIRGAGELTYAEIAALLEMDERQLRRIRAEVESARGAAPQPGSRRPEKTRELHREIQTLIQTIECSADTRDPYTATDVKRILEKNHQAKLRKYHGPAIARDTVEKYMQKEPKEKDRREHPRGHYMYPEPFQQVAIDTSYFEVFGFFFYLITTFELGARLNMVTRVFLREDTEAVVSVLEETFQRYPRIEVMVIDRGTPYLNDEVKRILEEHGKFRIVCPRATPTAKAACERHFRTLKETLRAALSRVFGADPGWPREQIAKVLEMGVAVFQELYHEIPQPEIDGKTPAERSESFDPARASRAMIELFERAIESVPAAEVAQEIHARFQLPGSEEKTIQTLQRFGGRNLRLLIGEVAPYFGPPHPKWMHDPLGYLAVKAREIFQREHQAHLAERHRREEHKRQKEKWQAEAEEKERRAQERREHPERFVDDALELAARFAALGIPGAERVHLAKLEELLVTLQERLGRAFRSEIERMKARLTDFVNDARVAERFTHWLDNFVRGSPLVSPLAGGGYRR